MHNDIVQGITDMCKQKALKCTEAASPLGNNTY